MLAMTQLGLVPPDVKGPQGEVFSIADKTRLAWAPESREYRSEDVRKISTAMNRAISGLVEALLAASSDSLVSDRSDLIARADAGIRELQKFQRALALPVEQSRKGATVDLPEFRSAIPAMMDRTAKIWVGMNPAHDVFMSWITAEQAESIAKAYRDILAVVQAIPGARSVGFLARNKGKVILGVAAVAVGGVGAWLLLKRRRSAALEEPELLPVGEAPLPVGIHVFSYDDESLAITGDPEDTDAFLDVIDIEETPKFALAAIADVDGINDPHIFKAILLAGGPGSGKSFIAKKMFNGQGLKFLNSDTAFEFLLNKRGLPLDIDLENPDQAEARAIAKSITAINKTNWTNGMLGLVVDGTGKNFKKLARIKQDLEKIGYTTNMLFVDTPLDVALERNRARARTVPDEVVEEGWTNVQTNRGKFKHLFKGNFYVVNNDQDLDSEGMKEFTKSLNKISGKILRAPRTNKTGENIIDALHESGGKTLRDLSDELRRKSD